MPTPNTNVNLGVGNVDIVYAIQNLQGTTTASVTISNGGTISGEVNKADNNLFGFVIPSTWDGGNITIQGCEVSGGTFLDVYDSYGNLITVTVAGSSRIIALTNNHLQAIAAIPYIKLKSASSVSADRIIKIIVKG
jgi:hypothetical protein